MKTIVGFITVILPATVIWGYIWNIVKFASMLDGNVTAMFIARTVGIFFPPLGAVLGFV